jgi:hypothetical protein
MRKHKIIDTIFFYDEIEMLYFRLSELDEYVDEFIIMECEMDFKGNPKPLNYLKNISLFNKWQHKITYLPTPILTHEDINPIYETISFAKKFNKIDPTIVGKDDIRFFQIITLIGILLEKPLGFDDLILISDVDEIPDLSKSELFKPHLKFGLIILRQTNFIWTTKYVDTIPNMGTIGFQFSRLISNPEIVYRPYFNKLNPPSSDFEIIDNGYHFSHFYDLKTTIKKIKLLNDENSDYKLSEIDDRINYSYENLTSIKTNDYEKNYNLIEYNGDLPKNIHLLKNQEIGRTWSKKNLILFIEEDNFNSLDIKEPFDNVCLINFTSNAKLPYETELSDKITQYNLLKPLNLFYRTSEDIMDLEKFQKIFCTNDIKKIIYDLRLINHDLITFSNNTNPSFKSTYSWKDVKNKYIYDLIKDIL